MTGYSAIPKAKPLTAEDLEFHTAIEAQRGDDGFLLPLATALEIEFVETHAMAQKRKFDEKHQELMSRMSMMRRRLEGVILEAGY